MKLENGKILDKMLQATEHFSPIISDNPKIDRAYRALRIFGLSQEESVEMLCEELSRRGIKYDINF